MLEHIDAVVFQVRALFPTERPDRKIVRPLRDVWVASASSRHDLTLAVPARSPRKLAGEDVELARSAKVSEAPTWKLSLDVPLEIDA